GFVAGRPQVAANVLYRNTLPTFPIEVPSSARFSAGSPPPKTDARQVLLAIRQLALERVADTATMELVGLQYVAVRLQRPGGTARYAATLALTRLNQVNAIELAFPAPVARMISSPTGTQGTPRASTLQLFANQGVFGEAVPYRFVFELASAPRRGSAFTVRASTHYFEHALPFVERFFFGQ